MSFKPPEADITPNSEAPGNRPPPDRATGRANGATPAVYGHRLGIAVFLNFIFLPLGFYYQRNVIRFWLFALFAVFGKSLLLFFLWTWPKFTWGWPHIVGIVIIVLGFQIYIIIETIRTHRREPMSDVFYMYTPHGFWFVPSLLVVFGILAVLIEPIEKSIIDANNIPQGSMAPTLQSGDFVYIDHLTGKTNIRRGDIIVFKPPGTRDAKYIKRVIGLPGERVRLISEMMGNGKTKVSVTRIEINGKKLPVKPLDLKPETMGLDIFFQEPTLVLEEGDGNRKYKIMETPVPHHQPVYSAAWGRGIKLGLDEYFLLGDNRDDSKDSRFIGAVKLDQVLGRYMYTYFSLNFHDFTCGAVRKKIREGVASHEIYPRQLCGDRHMGGSRYHLRRYKRATVRWKNIRVAE